MIPAGAGGVSSGVFCRRCSCLELKKLPGRDPFRYRPRTNSNRKSILVKLNALLILAAGALALSGCSSTPTTVDHGPIHAKTFSFVNPGAKPAPAYADNRQAAHTAIQEAITRNLTAKGVSKVSGGSDVTVGYLIIVGNNASTTSINDYFGYGSDAAALQDKAHSAYTGSKNPNYFEAGTLVIDITDAKTFKLLKRGYATRSILRDPTAETRAEHIQAAVDEILRDVRIAQ